MKDNSVREDLTPEEKVEFERRYVQKSEDLLKAIYHDADGKPRAFAETPAMLRELVEGVIQLVTEADIELTGKPRWAKTDARLAVGILHDELSAMSRSLAQDPSTALLTLLAQALKDLPNDSSYPTD